MKFLLFALLLPVAFAQWPRTHHAAAQPAHAGAAPARLDPSIHVPHSLHPVWPAPVRREPVGQVEERLRRIEVKLNLVTPDCSAPNLINPPKEMARVEYGADPNYHFHSPDPNIMNYARTAGYSGPEARLGNLGSVPYERNCECLIPLYRRNYDGHNFRVNYQTVLTYNRIEDLERVGSHWTVEGYCVPYRGACGATKQLSRMTPVDHEGDDRPLVLVTEDADRVLYGQDKGWDEQTLCYVW